jgi:cytochrome c-type biogenesis protein CcmE
LNSQRASLVGQPVRVNAPLDKGSIQFDDKSLTLKFNLKEDNLILPVVYKGVVPDTMDQGESVVAEGHLGADGVFQANQILVKCPSKYESQPTAPAK